MMGAPVSFEAALFEPWLVVAEMGKNDIHIYIYSNTYWYIPFFKLQIQKIQITTILDKLSLFNPKVNFVNTYNIHVYINMILVHTGTYNAKGQHIDKVND